MGQKILAIDDELHMLKLLERIVNEKTPYHITTLNNSLGLPDLLENNEFDLIITDLKMPGMDGLDVLEHVRKNNRMEEVIIITAFGSLETATDAMEKGVFDYITKPFKKEQITGTIDRAMRWMECKRKTECMTNIFDSDTYEIALEKFKTVYIKKAYEKHGNNIEETSSKTQIPIDEIKKVITGLE